MADIPGAATALQAARAGHVEFAVDVALGTSLGALSCTFNPVEVGGQILKAVQSLQDATEAAGSCKEICKDIMLKAEHRVPVVCEVLRLGQLFKDDRSASESCRQSAAGLNTAVRQCCEDAFHALQEAIMAMYGFLDCSYVSQLRQAASIKKVVRAKYNRMAACFDDVDSFMLLAAVRMLRDRQSEAQAADSTSVLRHLQQQVEDLKRIKIADRTLVRDLAQAAVARQKAGGQKIRVSKSQVWALAVSPSGECFATASPDGAAVWDAATGTHMHELQGHSSVVSSVAWSPDGSKVATASMDNTAAVWHVATGRRLHVLQGHRQGVLSVAWSPDGSKVATASADRTAVVWDVTTGSSVHELRGHGHGVLSVAWSPDGSKVATTSWDETAGVWDVASGSRTHELPIELQAGQLCAMDADFRASFDDISSSASPEEVAMQIAKAARSLKEAAAAAAICGEICRKMMIWIAHRAPIICELLHLGQLFEDVEAAPDLVVGLRSLSQAVVAALHEAVMALYEYVQCTTLSEWKQRALATAVMRQTHARVRSRLDDMDMYKQCAILLRSRQSRQQAEHTAALMQRLQLELELQALMRDDTVDKAQVKALAQAALSRQTPERHQMLVSETLSVGQLLAISLSGCCVAFASADQCVKVQGITTATPDRVVSTHRDWVRSLAWNPDGSRIATGSEDKIATVWDADTGEYVHDLRGHSAGVCSVAWSPDGSKVATASGDKTAAVWDAATGSRIHVLRGHGDVVNSVAWSVHGGCVYTASHDGAVRIYGVALRQ